MQSNRSKAASFLATAAIAGSLCPTEDIYAQSVSDRVLSDVTAQSVGTCATVSIAFNVRVQILSSFPQTGGRELHIRLKPLDGTSLSRESLRAPTGIPRSGAATGGLSADEQLDGPVLALLTTAKTQQGSGDFNGAASSLERAQRIAPREPQVLYRLAQVRLSQGDAPQAEQLARRALTYANGRPSLQAELWNTIAQAREKQGDSAGAALARQKARVNL